MQISFTRSKDDIKSISALRKSLYKKAIRIKIYLVSLVGVVLFFYNGDGINEGCFSGYGMLAMVFFGAALMLYLENFYPKLVFNAQDVIKDYKEYNSKDFLYKIEINDDDVIYEISGYYIRMNWSTVKSFKTYKNHIILLKSGNNYKDAIIIKHSELNEVELVEFYFFLKEKLPESNKKVN